jgi:hypothetical protein
VYSTLLFFPCYSNQLLRRRGCTKILRRGVLGYVLPWLSFLWCYGVFRCSVPLRVIIVFRDTIYVIIIILYSWQLIIYEPFWSYVWNNWSWVMHTMSTWFWCKNWVWQMRPFLLGVLLVGADGVSWWATSSQRTRVNTNDQCQRYDVIYLHKFCY